MNKREDEVYRKLVDEYTTVENAPFGNTKYHKSCYKAFTSKQNLSTCSNFKSRRPTSASCNQIPSSYELKMDYKPTDITKVNDLTVAVATSSKNVYLVDPKLLTLSRVFTIDVSAFGISYVEDEYIAVDRVGTIS